MALHWDFKCKAGTVEAHPVWNGVQRDVTFNFYEGNALMITTFEYEKDGDRWYDMVWFFMDKEHARRCLGLKKCPDGTTNNMLDEQNITRITIYRNNCYQWKTLIDLFSRAIPNADIQILADDPDTRQSKEA